MTSGHHVNWLPFALALLLALLSFWLNRLTDRSTLMDNGGFSHDPDYIVEHFDALTFDAAGQPQYRLTAELMTHYMDDGTTVLVNPLFQTKNQIAPTEISARRAQLSGDGQLVHFLTQVHIVRTSPGDKAVATMDTDYLQISPDQHTMFTNKRVTFRQGKSVITAEGLSADDKKQLFSLSGGVRGTYEKAR